MINPHIEYLYLCLAVYFCWAAVYVFSKDWNNNRHRKKIWSISQFLVIIIFPLLPPWTADELLFFLEKIRLIWSLCFISIILLMAVQLVVFIVRKLKK